jgi:hypothetical protein
MADLTAPECAGIGEGSCRVPHTCCDELACSITKAFAASQGVTLPEYPPRDHRGAFYLSESGCTVAPHLRPLCTLHTCKINGLGFKPGDPKWTAKYFRLRAQIERLDTRSVL